MLIVFGGLPATGKTTIARLAQRRGAAFLRIDAIEYALRSAQVLAGDARAGLAGYAIAYALSEANLKLGQAAVADCVNPLPITRTAWRAVAVDAASKILTAIDRRSVSATALLRASCRRPDPAPAACI